MHRYTKFLQIIQFHFVYRFPKFKRYITEITDEIIDYLTGDKATIVALYTISDSYYRVII